MADPKEHVLHNGDGWEIIERRGSDSPLRFWLLHGSRCVQAESLAGLRQRIRDSAEQLEAEANDLWEILSKIDDRRGSGNA